MDIYIKKKKLLHFYISIFCIILFYNLKYILYKKIKIISSLIILIFVYNCKNSIIIILFNNISDLIIK